MLIKTKKFFFNMQIKVVFRAFKTVKAQARYRIAFGNFYGFKAIYKSRKTDFQIIQPKKNGYPSLKVVTLHIFYLAELFKKSRVL